MGASRKGRDRRRQAQRQEVSKVGRPRAGFLKTKCLLGGVKRGKKGRAHSARISSRRRSYLQGGKKGDTVWALDAIIIISGADGCCSGPLASVDMPRWRRTIDWEVLFIRMARKARAMHVTHRGLERRWWSGGGAEHCIRRGKKWGRPELTR